MPNFTVRRKKKPKVHFDVERPKTPAPNLPEEKESDEETMSTDGSYIDEVVDEIKKTTIATKTEAPQYKPQYTPVSRPQYKQLPKGAQTLYGKTDNQPQYRRPVQMNDPYRRKPTMEIHSRASNYRRGGSKLRYKSHYDIAGERMDTRTKAYMLYNHCFG